MKIKLLAAMIILAALMPLPSFAQSSSTFLAGAHQIRITPEVAEYDDLNNNGVFDLGDPTKAFGFGDRVRSFVDSKVFVGNGNGEALYIYDHLYAYALIIKDPVSGRKVAFAGADVYLFTGPDAELIRSKVDASLGIDHIVIAATHNHMGPDTLGVSALGFMKPARIINAVFSSTADVESGINRSWYEKLQNAIVKSIETAAKNMQPATIRFSQTPFTMGLADLREPIIMDDMLRLMAVDGLDGKPIATMMQWANHPEAVLEYGRSDREYPPLPYDSLSEVQKEAWGRVLTAGFPGYARAKLSELRGGVTLYFNGAVGGMQTPLRAKLWDPEKHADYPANTPPEQVPDDILIPNDFRFAPVLGRELAKAANDSIKNNSVTAQSSSISYSRKHILLPMENHFYRAMASMGVLGYAQGHLYDDEGNIDDSFGSWIGGLFVPGLTAYTGKNLRAEISVVNIGQSQFVNIPAEVLPELIVGFPDDFTTNVDKYFPNDSQHHPTGADYKLSNPPLADAATGDFLFTIGLSMGELGYVIPKSDFDPPRDIKIPPLNRWWICLDASNHPHYEESNSLTGELEPILMGELYKMLSDMQVTNTD